jgi:hypothetical protein
MAAAPPTSPPTRPSSRVTSTSPSASGAVLSGCAAGGAAGAPLPGGGDPARGGGDRGGAGVPERVLRLEAQDGHAWAVSFAFAKADRRVSVYYFYVLDRDFGPGFIKLCSYFPYPAKVWVNGHEWAKRQAAREGLAFTELANGFASCEDPAALQAICDVFYTKLHNRLLGPLLAADRPPPHPSSARPYASSTTRSTTTSNTLAWARPRELAPNAKNSATKETRRKLQTAAPLGVGVPGVGPPRSSPPACWSGAAPRPPRATGVSGPRRRRSGQGAAEGRASTHEYAATLDRGGGEVAAPPAGNRPVRVRAQGSRARRGRWQPAGAARSSPLASLAVEGRAFLLQQHPGSGAGDAQQLGRCPRGQRDRRPAGRPGPSAGPRWRRPG